MELYVWIQIKDDLSHQIEESVAKSCPMICREVVENNKGSSKNCAVSLPPCVTSTILGLILDYCRFYQIKGRSEKECKAFDETFISKDEKTLCELGTAAVSLEITPLIDLTCEELARQTKDKTPKEVSKLFHLNDELDEEEDLENIKYMTGYSRVLLFKRFSDIKNQELQVRKTLKDIKVVEKPKDERSINDLLKFINESDCGTSTVKKKKKNRRMKEKSKDLSLNTTLENNNKNKECKEDFEEDFEDDFDPLMKEEIDRLAIFFF
ncbi:SKP1-like protein 20 [Vicia villosa]|uniref:SKP1-like protein 20 n=1 Tax=Vicia villosa TaxID=3911 RepID=UPI00273B238B|nr:SKP1-like protein 20 [Vicia villosa]